MVQFLIDRNRNDQASALTTWPQWFKILIRYLNHCGQVTVTVIKAEARSVRFWSVHIVVNVALILSLCLGSCNILICRSSQWNPVFWIALRIRDRSRNTQPCLKNSGYTQLHCILIETYAGLFSVPVYSGRMICFWGKRGAKKDLPIV